jgi:hypothetical protein
MKKKLFLFLGVFLIYFILFIVGLKSNAYVDINTKDSILYKKYIVLLIVLSLVIGGGLLYWIMRIFEEYPRKSLSYFFQLLGSAILSFVLNTGVLELCNFSIGRQESIMIQGHVRWKNIKEKRGLDSYFVVVADTVTYDEYKFKVDEETYKSIELGEIFVKEFKTGSLGIVYRKSQ